MIAWFSRARRAPKAFARSSLRPELERLEDRLCLSTGGTPTEALALNVSDYQPDKQVTLTGYLLGPNGAIANGGIEFHGAVSGSTTTNAQGMFSTTLTASSLGQVTAISSDGFSNTAMATLMGGTPIFNTFQAISEGNGIWMLTGNVSGTPTQGEVIHFDGPTALNNATCNVNPDGSFCYYCYIPAGQGGTIVAEAVDWYGDESQTVASTAMS